MLKEMFCDKFIKYGEIREKIIFNPVLNVVEGSDSGKNSIGKSTFLMCVDFAFGGNDYIEKLKDVKKNIGDHTICFTFEFDKIYYFSRSTASPDKINICNEDYSSTGKTMKLDEYTSFLKEKYSSPISDLSFRQIVSRFLRIYNRENLNELLPLRSFDSESEKVSISELIKLFNLYTPIKEANELNDEISNKKEAFTKAQKYSYLPKITETEYNKNIIEIEKLIKEAEELAEKSDKGLLELKAEKADLAARIKSEIANLKRKRAKYYNQLDLYKKDTEYEPATYQKDFKELETYFNNVNIQNLQEIENFHIQLSSILKNELKKSIADTWANINLLTEAINEYEKELEQVQSAKNVSKVILKTYSSIERQIEELKKINDYHIHKKELDKEAKKAAQDLEQKIMLQSTILISELNTKMKEINNNIYNEGTSSPVLQIPSSKSYVFETPNDQGTGTKYKGMIILDLAILALTSLPILAHDSIMFANMSFDRIENTFKLYSNSNKQIFVAVDKTVQLNEEASQIIRNNRILLLSPNGNELFGRAWNKSEE